MKKNVLFLSILLASVAVSAETQKHWEYSGETGPQNWATLTPEFGACSGKNQSPINLTGFIEANLKPIKFSYTSVGSEIVNNGHTVQVNYATGSSITLDGIQYELKQFHLHAPSENLINGKSYPMEAHLVHADKDGNLAVVGVMLAEGKENKALAKIWPQIPREAGEKQTLSSAVTASGLLPTNRDYYRFNGSLTTPPCSEGVRWLVMKKPITASKQQIETFTQAIHHANNRPIQPANARPVLQ
ncbi:MAG: carbonic anhydrase family protein [Methylophilaceae bacterium]